MIRRHNLRLAYRSFKAARTRNVLTMLGIIIGVLAVVLVVCVGTGIKRQVAGQLDRYGKDVVNIQPAERSGTATGLAALSSTLLTDRDLRTVADTDGISTAVPLTTASGSMKGDYTLSDPFIIATTADFADVARPAVAYGGMFDGDTDSRTVTLGIDVARKLFKDNAPLGETLHWRGQDFTVAGVFDAFAAPPFSVEADFNEAVFVPYSTAQSLSGNSLGIFRILAKTDPDVTVGTVTGNVRKALAKTHGNAGDISVQPAGKASGASDQTVQLLTLFVIGAALVAMIVGGVGIMDVMLVSVTERMHEIGLRKAIGATNKQIMRQFMAEAFVICAVGAVVGIAFSAVAIGLLRLFSSLQPVFVWQAFVIAPVVAVAIGLFFGILPALKAARKDPIEALRHE